MAPGAVNEQQEVRLRASDGQFKLSFKGQPTADLAFDAPGSESEGPGSVEAALNALPSIGGVGGEVSVEALPGTPDGKTPFIYVVAFKGSLAGTDVAQLTITNGTTPLSGGVPSSSLEARTRADGTAAGTGLESCTAESGCKAGLQGGGTGQFDRARGVAIDAAGNLYVREVTNHRVQKFDSAGRFLSMFGGEVNKTKVEAAAPQAEQNICPIDPGDVCQAGTTGTANGQFGPGLSGGIALCTGSLFVADKDRIQRFSLAGAFEASLPESRRDRAEHSPATRSAATSTRPSNPNRTSTSWTRPRAKKSATSKSKPRGRSPPTPPGTSLSLPKAKVLEFDSAGKPLLSVELLRSGEIRSSHRAASAPTPPETSTSHTTSGPAATNFIRIYGPAPVIFEAPPQVPPTITAQFATSVGRDDATVAAEINPHFWTNTRYYVAVRHRQML